MYGSLFRFDSVLIRFSTLSRIDSASINKPRDCFLLFRTFLGLVFPASTLMCASCFSQLMRTHVYLLPTPRSLYVNRLSSPTEHHTHYKTMLLAYDLSQTGGWGAGAVRL